MVHVLRVSVATPEEMVRLGVHIGRHLSEGAVVGLSGPLGAGKTTIARGIAEGLEIDEGYLVSSPTYTIMHVYPCSRLDLYHLDLYRISGVEDLDSTGYRDASGEGKVLLVEWFDREPSVLPEEHLRIHIGYAEYGRDVSLTSTGSFYDSLLREIARSGDLPFLRGSVDSEQCRC